MLDRTSTPAALHSSDDLLGRIRMAVSVANDAERRVTTAQEELVTRSKAVGVLLLEAKKLHPKVKDFELFLKRVDGLSLSRAYDCLRIAGGRITDEEIRKATRDRVKKHRDKKKPLKKPEPKPDSVTGADVTEKRKPAAQESFNSPQEAHARPEAPKPGAELDKASSARALAEFTFACQTYLPKMTPPDLFKAVQLVTDHVKAREQKAREHA